MARRRQLVAPRERETPTPVRRTAAPLVVGAAGDAAEREADRVADQVLTRLRGGEAHDHDCSAHRGHDVSRTPSTAPTGAEVGRDGGEISADLSSRIEAGRSGGTALSGAVRERMEAGFGESLGDVRIHTGAESADLNRSVSARAFTVGRDVFFGQGEYRPDTPEGEQVLAHEIAHTRQEGGAARRTIRRWDLGARRMDWTQTARLGVQGSGKFVYFLEDRSGDKVAVKSERNPIGLSELGSAMHLQLSGVPSVRHRPLDDTDVAGIRAVFQDRGLLDRAQWERLGAFARGDNRLLSDAAQHLGVDRNELGGFSDLEVGYALHANRWSGPGMGQMVAMSFAVGDSAEKAATMKGTNPYEAGEANRMRTLLSDPKHVHQLGLLNAVDLFFGNDDRVHGANFGNWMYDPRGEAMTLIDHVNSTTASGFSDRVSEVPKLAQRELRSSTEWAIESFCLGMEAAGDREFRAWLAHEDGKMRKRMLESFERGMVEGRKLLIKTFTATRFSGSSKARAVKKSIKHTGREAAQMDGVADRDDYYKTLKRRAEWLKKH